MATHKSAAKRNRQTVRKNERNRTFRSRMRNSIVKFNDIVKDEDAKAGEEFKKVASLISKSASKGVVHKKAASRKISRLAKLLNKSSK